MEEFARFVNSMGVVRTSMDGSTVNCLITVLNDSEFLKRDEYRNGKGLITRDWSTKIQIHNIESIDYRPVTPNPSLPGSVGMYFVNMILKTAQPDGNGGTYRATGIDAPTTEHGKIIKELLEKLTKGVH